MHAFLDGLTVYRYINALGRVYGVKLLILGMGHVTDTLWNAVLPLLTNAKILVRQIN
jgi:hypothetical protein